MKIIITRWMVGVHQSEPTTLHQVCIFLLPGLDCSPSSIAVQTEVKPSTSLKQEIFHIKRWQDKIKITRVVFCYRPQDGYSFDCTFQVRWLVFLGGGWFLGSHFNFPWIILLCCCWILPRVKRTASRQGTWFTLEQRQWRHTPSETWVVRGHPYNLPHPFMVNDKFAINLLSKTGNNKMVANWKSNVLWIYLSSFKLFHGTFKFGLIDKMVKKLILVFLTLL